MQNLIALNTIEKMSQFLDFEHIEHHFDHHTIKRNGKVIIDGGRRITEHDLSSYLRTELPTNKLVRKQNKSFTKSGYHSGYNCKVDVVCDIRFDDQCGNGHNSFSITGSVYEAGKRSDRSTITCGCIHEDIYLFFPEFRHLIKWHLVSSDEPMHYVANTMYSARETDTEGKKEGQATKFDAKLQFNGSPFTFKESEKGFFKYLNKNRKNFKSIVVEPVPYDGKDNYNFEPNYTLSGFIGSNSSIGKWYSCPFKTKTQAEEFLKALQQFKFKLVKIPTVWCKAVVPKLESARTSASWGQATLEQLQNKDLLNRRLPTLLNELKVDVEALDMVF